MHALRVLSGLFFSAILFCQLIPAYSATYGQPPHTASYPPQINKDHNLPIKDPVEEKDHMLKIILNEVNKRVSTSNFSRGMDDFINWIDGIITRTRRLPSIPTPVLKKSIDPTETIMEILSESFYRDDLIRILNELKSSLALTKRDTLYLPQISVFQSLSPEAQNEFRAGERVEDRLDELPRMDKRRIDKLSISPDHLKILLIQRLTQSTGMGRDRVSTLNDNKRVLNEFKSKLPATMALRSFIDTLLINLDKKAGEQSAAALVSLRIIDFLSPVLQEQFRRTLGNKLITMQDEWDTITQIEANNVVPLWIDQDELERQRLLDEAENKKKEEEAERRRKIEEEEQKRKAEKAKQEAEAKKSQLEKAKDKLKNEAKEKAKDAAGDATRNLLKGVFGENAAGSGDKGSNPIGGLLGGLGF